MRPPARSTWFVTPYYAHGWEHGSHLRTFAIAREWVRQGAEVHFLALEFEHTDPALPGPYLERLRDSGVITGFHRLRLQHPRFRGKAARAALHPAIKKLVLGPEYRAMVSEINEVVRAVSPNACVFTDYHLLFALPYLRRYAPVTIDWKDSVSLYQARDVRAALQRRAWRHAVGGALRQREWALFERYYGTRADHNVFVSPIDAAAMTHLLGGGATVHTIPNGIRARPALSAGARDPNRLIFTGAMNYPPNHHSAVWFIRHVLPRIVARRPEVRLVVAGSHPLPELRALGGPNVAVTGWVDDMRAELAGSALYVAPMIAGNGFKNKVVEALATGTNVVGTTLAFEFLPERLRALFHSANEPDALADAVLRHLDDPPENARTAVRFWELAGDEYDWEHVAERMARVAASGCSTPACSAQALF